MTKRAAPVESELIADGLDEVDLAILRLLVEDARLSARAIAREVGMSPGAISERIDRLQTRGVITGYHASISLASLGFPIRALIGLQVVHGAAVFSEVVDRIMEVPQVRRVQIVTGEWDLLVEVQVRDHDDLRDVLIRGIWSIPGFRHSQTMVMLEERARPTISSIPGADGTLAER